MEKVIDYITDNLPTILVVVTVLLCSFIFYQEYHYPCKEYKEVVTYTSPTYITSNWLSIPMGGGSPYLSKVCTKR